MHHSTRRQAIHSAFTRLLSFLFAVSIGLMAMAQNTMGGISGASNAPGSSTRNSSVNTGLNVTRANNSSAEPTYTFTEPTATYSIDQFSSRWQMQLGLRYSF